MTTLILLPCRLDVILLNDGNRVAVVLSWTYLLNLVAEAHNRSNRTYKGTLRSQTGRGTNRSQRVAVIKGVGGCSGAGGTRNPEMDFRTCDSTSSQIRVSVNRPARVRYRRWHPLRGHQQATGLSGRVSKCATFHRSRRDNELHLLCPTETQHPAPRDAAAPFSWCRTCIQETRFALWLMTASVMSNGVLWTDATNGVRSSHGARVFNVQAIDVDNVEGVQSYPG